MIRFGLVAGTVIMVKTAMRMHEQVRKIERESVERLADRPKMSTVQYMIQEAKLTVYERMMNLFKSPNRNRALKLLQEEIDEIKDKIGESAFNKRHS